MKAKKQFGGLHIFMELVKESLYFLILSQMRNTCAELHLYGDLIEKIILSATMIEAISYPPSKS